ncbi:MAG: hypothetical protein JXR48_14005 [Candidatus Delongbacteria bacterium]|nr:hypothetical protein [Candidatus Delongbacteria bacterium]MBN2836069.1 hypothetical protein [Candidatus Delongbacteria bacterium]
MIYRLCILLILVTSILAFDPGDDGVSEIIEILSLTKIDLNKTSEVELIAVPYITDDLANKIVQSAEEKPFTKISELVTRGIINLSEYEIISSIFTVGTQKKVLKINGTTTKPYYTPKGEIEKKYLGNDYYYKNRILFDSENITFGILLEKDSWELHNPDLLKYNFKYSTDFIDYSFGNFIVKSPRLGFYEGSGFQDNYTVSSNKSIILADITSNEAYDLKGIKLNSNYGLFEISVAGMNGKFSTGKEYGKIKSLLSDGSFMTESELDRKYNSQFQRGVLFIGFTKQSINISTGFIYDYFEDEFIEYDNYPLFLSGLEVELFSTRFITSAILKKSDFFIKEQISFDNIFFYGAHNKIDKPTFFSENPDGLKADETVIGLKLKGKRSLKNNSIIFEVSQQDKHKKLSGELKSNIKFSLLNFETNYKSEMKSDDGNDNFIRNTVKFKIWYEFKTLHLDYNLVYSKDEECDCEGVMNDVSLILKNIYGLDLKTGAITYKSLKGKNSFYKTGTFEKDNVTMNNFSGDGVISYIKLEYSFDEFSTFVGYYKHNNYSDINFGTGNDKIYSDQKSRLTFGFCYSR